MSTRVCADEQCEATFTPTRSDAEFCSSACRQRTYRQRAKVRAGMPHAARWALSAGLGPATEALARHMLAETVTDSARLIRNAEGDR